jgi:hypothetical protein
VGKKLMSGDRYSCGKNISGDIPWEKMISGHNPMEKMYFCGETQHSFVKVIPKLK